MSSTVFIFASLCLVSTRKSQPPYPPGPPPKPIIGNALDIPFKKPWLKYLEWSKRFNNGIIHLCALRHHIVVLNKMEDVAELMERRSSKYSGRPASPISKLLDIEMLTALLPYGSALRKHRKFLEENLRKDVVHRYRQLVTEKVHIFMEQLLQDPVGFDEHCNTLSTSVSLATTFGYDVIAGKKTDPFVEAGQYAIASTSEIILPGRTLIVVFPFLRHIPPWFPGVATQRFCAQIRDAYVRYRIGSFEYVKRNMAAGIAKDCIAKRLLERSDLSTGPFGDEETLTNAVLNLYVALVIFILAMTVIHPLEQQRAQHEIDQLIGSDRLPTFDDRSSLPYVEALYREVLRWRPIAPLAVPHSTDADDLNLVPFSGITQLCSLQTPLAITRDSTTYPDPEEFRPERFFKEDGTLIDDNIRYVFGFGRR
ncbi:Cytochrome P450 [Amanita muscaria]